MNLFLNAFLLTLTVLTTGSISSQKTDLELHLKKGETYKMKMEMGNIVDQEMMGNKVHIDQKITTETELKVEDILANGNYLIGQTYKRVAMNVSSNGQSMSFDTDIKDAASPLASLNDLKGASIKYELSPKGDISNVTGIDEILKNAGALQAKTISGIIDKDKLAGAFSYIPKNKIKEGDSYTKTIKLKEAMGIDVTTKYTVETLTKEKASIKLSSDIEFKSDKPIEQNGMKMRMSGHGTQSGMYRIDMKTGMPQSADTDQDINMTVMMKNPQTGKDMAIPMKIKSLVKLSVTKR